MVITVPTQARPGYGLRPINLNRDIPEVIRLLEMVFGKTLGMDGQLLLSGGLGLDHQPAFLWRLSPGASRLAMGYVWEEDGRIIGNATVMSTKSADRYLVVNVAVHPDFRRRGIALNLMDTVMDMVQARQGKEIRLQVEKDNDPAQALYRSLDFVDIGSMTTWRATVSGLREVASIDTEPNPRIRELHRTEWQAAYELDLTALKPDLNWPESLPQDTYRGGVWRWLDRVINGRRLETWVVASGRNRLFGLAGIWSEWGRPHRVSLRVHPDWRGKLERPLLAKVVRRLRHLPRRNIRLDHPDEDDLMNQMLPEASFRSRRTLTHMRLFL
jgi:ribosomal protein S18 acetylase RimI-like enzyme